jgi:hypothetical protein
MRKHESSPASRGCDVPCIFDPRETAAGELVWRSAYEREAGYEETGSHYSSAVRDARRGASDRGDGADGCVRAIIVRPGLRTPTAAIAVQVHAATARAGQLAAPLNGFDPPFPGHRYRLLPSEDREGTQMRIGTKELRVSAVVAILIAGALPSCTPDNQAIDVSNTAYGAQYRSDGIGTGPAVGCSRVPPPTQC